MALNETGRARIFLDGKQAESALEALKQKAKDLEAALKKAADAGDNVKMKKIQSELTGVEAATRSLKKETFDYERVLKNLNGSSLNDLKKALRTVEIQMGKMSRTDPGYQKMAAHAKLLRNEINSTTGAMRAQQSTWGKLADGFNKYMGIGAAAIASIAGISMTIKSAMKAYTDFDDKLSDVRKTTGLTADEVKRLSEELSKIDTRTSQLELLDLARVAGKLGITGEENILGFVRAADQIRVALTEDLGGDVEDSINQIGKLVDIFKLKDEFGMEQALLKTGSAINSLGAASTANEGYLVEFAKRVAGIAPSAGVSIQNVLGLAATLDQLGQTAEVSGTVYNQVISAMFKDQATYANLAGMEIGKFTDLLNTDANEAFIKVLEGLKGNNSGFAEMAQRMDDLGLDGARATQVLGVLANNTEILRTQQGLSNEEFEKGISLTNEFNVKNSNAAAQLDKAKKSFAALTVELGEKLTPAYTSIISKARFMLDAISATVSFMSKYWKQIVTVASAIVGYTIAVKIAANWTRIQTAYTLTATTVEKAYGVMKSLLTGKITLATIAQRAWNLALKANPIGLIVGLIAGAVAWLIQFDKKTGKVSEALRKAGDFVIDLANQFVELYNSSLPVRVAVQALVAYIKTGFAVAKGAVIAFINPLKLVGKLIKAALTFDVQGIKDAFKDFGSDVKDNVNDTVKEVGDIWADGMDKALHGKMKPIERKVVVKTDVEKEGDIGDTGTGKQTPKLPGSGEEDFPKPPGDDDNLVKDKDKGKKKTPEEIAKEELNKKMKVLDDANSIEVAAITKRYNEQKSTEEQYQAELLNQEMKFISDKMALLDKGSAEYADLETKYTEKQIQAREKMNELLAKADEQLEQAKIDNLEDGLEKEKAIEQKRWDDELEKLENQLIKKQELSQQEIDYNQKINEQIELNKAAHLKKMNDLDQASTLKKKMDDALLAEATAETDAERYAAKRALVQANYDQDVADAAGNAAKIAQANKKLSDDLLQIKIDEIDAFREINQAKIDMAANVLNIMADLVGEETVLGKALFLMQQAMAIGQVIFNTAIANAKAVATSPLTAGMPWVAINTASAAISIASIVGQSIKKFSGGKSEKSGRKSLAEGGYTPPGGKYEPAGVVHAGEWVAPQELVKSPVTSPVISWLEMIRKSGSMATINLPAVKATPRGYASGGTVQPAAAPAPGSDDSAATNRKLIEAINRLTSWEPSVAVELIQKGLNTLDNINKNSKL